MAGVLACSAESPAPAPAIEPSPVLAEHRTALAETASNEVGEDCTKHGASGCKSGLCLHTGALPDEGYFCSQTCTGEAQCPAQWKCSRVHPGASARVCIPPAEWKGAVAPSRG
ncbi:hypothetical protein [Corallococcus sp. CA054B]|uniref:hypothetical protein n=1 Tax=Corallococcus sp. CA054B TaxID=2316734 RepID=UPI00131586B7|nr:hypothetical protein [Corallococcus sp. CA054B]